LSANDFGRKILDDQVPGGRGIARPQFPAREQDAPSQLLVRRHYRREKKSGLLVNDDLTATRNIG